MQFSPQTRITISFLWTYVGLNMVFADVLSLYTPGTLPQVLEGTVEGVALSDMLMLVAAACLQIALVMIVLAQVLPPRWCKYANIFAALFTAAFIVGGGSLKPHYILFASFEIGALLTILALVLRRPQPEHAR